MPIMFEAGEAARAVFAGRCVPEEADALLEWLRATPDAAADLGGCENLHTALAQLLMAARVRVLTPPADPVLAACLYAGGCAGFVANPPPMPGEQKPRRGNRKGRQARPDAVESDLAAGAA